MNHGPILFLIAFLALASSWFGMVLLPQTQIGQLQPTNTIGSGASPYPLGSPGLAKQGLEVYRAQGCAYCHSQQVRQKGTTCEVVLNETGTNESAVIRVLLEKSGMAESKVKEWVSKLPQTIIQGIGKIEGEAQVKALRSAGAKADLWIVPFGPDIARGYGKRHSIAEDFLFDSTTMPGSIRIGPDLANVGARVPDRDWQLRHLYSPALEVKGSPMPPYRYLFEKRRITHGRSPAALALPAEVKVPDGYEIVPKPEANALVAYLESLRVEAPLYQAPLSVAAPPPQPGTNNTADATNAPSPTNAISK